MDSTETYHDGFTGNNFEQKLYKSLSLLLKNVSEFFNYSIEENDALLNYYNVNHEIQSYSQPSSSSSTFPEESQSTYESFLLTLTYAFIITLLTWTINRFTLKSHWIRVCTEGLMAWILVLPFAIPGLGLLLLLRTVASILIQYQYKGKYEIMNPFDAVWTFELPHSTSTCIGLYVIKGDGDIEKIRKTLLHRVFERVDENGRKIYERFKWSIENVLGFMCWRKDATSYKVDEHIKYFQTENIGPDQVWTEKDLFREIGRLQDISLIKDGESPWEGLVVPKFKTEHMKDTNENHYAIVWRVHHSISDGISMGHILHVGIADQPFTFSVDPTAPLKISKLKIILGYIMSFFFLPKITLTNAFFIEENGFHNHEMLTGPKTVNWAHPIKLKTIKEIKEKSNTSVFAVLMSCLTGSMRKLYQKHGHDVPKIIHACPPVAILPYPDRNPHNRFSVVLYPLATGKENAIDRLQSVHKASKKLASSPDVLANYFAIGIMGLAPYFVIKFLAPLAHATITFSNIPGPTHEVKVFNGDELVELGAWVPIKNRIGIGMALFSYNDKLRVTFISDKLSLPNSEHDVELLRNYFETEVVTIAQSLGVDEDKIFM